MVILYCSIYYGPMWPSPQFSVAAISVAVLQVITPRHRAVSRVLEVPQLVRGRAGMLIPAVTCGPQSVLGLPHSDAPREIPLFHRASRVSARSAVARSGSVINALATFFFSLKHVPSLRFN